MGPTCMGDPVIGTAYVHACPPDIRAWGRGRGDLRRARRARLWVEQARTSARLWVEQARTSARLYGEQARIGACL
jgi:hypothetical protein